MRKGKLIWAPFPYRAGFCITDDTDAADFKSVKIVYDFLVSINLITTKTVWVFPPNEPCGIPPTPDSTLRGVTLQDKRYLEYCKDLSGKGFEISLHCASSGNNLRERTQRAFSFLEKEFGKSDTYIAHSKNADNPYWEEKVAPNRLLRFFLSRYSRHNCSGEEPESPYFWGDICREKISQIRLFRTRKIFTLAVNPSMPYYEKAKPFVNGWFSASKRSFRDCTEEMALEKLTEENGLTVLYQYLHRYAERDTGRVDTSFQIGAERLMKKKEIWVATVSDIMSRLRRIQHIFVIYYQKTCWIINAQNSEIVGLQVLLPEGVVCTECDKPFDQSNNILSFPEVKRNSIVTVNFSHSIAFSGPRCRSLPANNRISIRFGHGVLCANLGKSKWSVDKEVALHPGHFYLRRDSDTVNRLPQDEDIENEHPIAPALAKASGYELLRLFFGQCMIIAREVMLKGRSLNSDKFLESDDILLENHNQW